MDKTPLPASAGNSEKRCSQSHQRTQQNLNPNLNSGPTLEAQHRPTTTAWEWAPLDETELCNACSTANVKGKTPGPDGITQEIIHKAYKAIPVTFLRVFNTLIYEQGHHPNMLAKGNRRHPSKASQA